MSDYLDPNNEELLKDFFVEANGQIEALERNILVLENDPANRDAVDEIFRAAHTLKGGAGTVEMTELQQFTHIVEDVLDAIRSGNASASGDMVDVLLASIDIIKAMLDARSAGHAYSHDVSDTVMRLKGFLGKGGASKPPVGKPHAAQAAGPSAEAVPASESGLSEYELLELKDAAGRDRHVYRVRIGFDENNPMNTVGSIHAYASLRDLGTVLKTVPEFEKLYEDTFYPVVDYYLASSQDAEAIRRKSMISDVTLSCDVVTVIAAGGQSAPRSPAGKPAEARAPAKADAARAAARVAEAAAEARVESKPDLPSDERDAADGKKAAATAGSVLRVDSKRIDNLLNLVSETVINKATFNQISTIFGELQNRMGSLQSQYREQLKALLEELPSIVSAMQEGRTVKDVKKSLAEKYGGVFDLFDSFEADFKNNVGKFRSTAQNLGRITGELQEGVMRIRMVPISQIFSRFPRLVRDLSKSLGKKVDLKIEGEDTELDKSVIEDLLDPLMHAVRNALDHGVEMPEERAAAGKAELGTVLLKASNEGNMILIEISDDGKGIDVEAVRKKAVDRGIIHPSKVLNDVEAFNLIFEPGFSTAKSVTNISGRGVGLDVVKRQIEKLNGTVTVSSQRGKGTRFVIKLPLTLAIIQGLLVRVGKEVYSIPITSVIESHRIKPAEIKLIDNYEVFNVRTDVISLLRLNRLFRIETSEQREYHFVVIVGTSEKKVGLIVDSLIGEEDVVIKPLRDQFTNSPGIAGASILGDGSVCLIIDVSQLLELGQMREIEERRKLELTIR
jgi:two-component system chemotaxis sensor kinase CheA